MNIFTQSLQRQRGIREQGFTLIELLVVILIIGILAAIAVPMFLNQRKAAVDATLKSDVRNLALELVTWKTQNPTAKAYPSAAWRNGLDSNPMGSHNLRGLDFTPSDGNSLRTYHNTPAGADGFCIEAWNSGSTEYTSELSPYTYFQENGTPGRPYDC